MQALREKKLRFECRAGGVASDFGLA